MSGAITGIPEVDEMTPSQAFHAGRRSAAAEIERLQHAVALYSEGSGKEIARLELANRQSMAIADERSRENVALRAGLDAAIRAAKLAVFVIRKQGVMPNSSWESGFEQDLKTATTARGDVEQ